MLEFSPVLMWAVLHGHCASEAEKEPFRAQVRREPELSFMEMEAAEKESKTTF